MLKLIKSLYGLKQSPRQWHLKLLQVLSAMDFKLAKCEASIWVYQKGDTRVIVPVFVDDLLIVSPSAAENTRIKQELQKAFKLRDLGAANHFLGVLLVRDRQKRQMSLSQSTYAQEILERYGFSDCSSVSTPLDPGASLSRDQSPKTKQELEQMRHIPYAHAVGSLMYLAISTHPDIAYAVGVLGRFNSNPGMAHWNAVKHLFRYIKGTLDYKLVLGPSDATKEMFTTYSDADFGGCKSTGRSTGAWVVKLGSGVVSWSSKLQPFVTGSTTEAEYIAAYYAGQEICWLRNLLTELGYTFTGPSTLYMDNMSAINVAKNPEHHGRMKHLDIKYYWLREKVNDGVIKVLHCPTAQMPADLLTKPLVRVKVLNCAKLLGLHSSGGSVGM